MPNIDKLAVLEHQARSLHRRSVLPFLSGAVLSYGIGTGRIVRHPHIVDIPEVFRLRQEIRMHGYAIRIYSLSSVSSSFEFPVFFKGTFRKYSKSEPARARRLKSETSSLTTPHTLLYGITLFLPDSHHIQPAWAVKTPLHLHDCLLATARPYPYPLFPRATSRAHRRP